MYAFMAAACAIAAVTALFVGPPQHHQPGEEEF
jgi:hypothetical protein